MKQIITYADNKGSTKQAISSFSINDTPNDTISIIYTSRMYWKNLWKLMLLVVRFTFIQTDLNEIVVKYQITLQGFWHVDIYHQGIGAFTVIACCYQKQEEWIKLQYANYFFVIVLSLLLQI